MSVLLGSDLHGTCASIIGTGTIGAVVAGILSGLGCEILAHYVVRNPACEEQEIHYVSMHELLMRAQILTLHCPLTRDNHHLLNREKLQQMRDGVMLINTSRGGLPDTHAVLDALKTAKIGALGLDAYEEEQELFFEDVSDTVITDDLFTRLVTLPNVLITAHQGVFTQTAMENIAATTITDLSEFDRSGDSQNRIPV